MKNQNLVEDLFAINGGFEAAAFCTYTCDLQFLESYLLHLPGMALCDNISIFTDISTYRSFGDTGFAPRHLNKKYLVTPLHTSGVFHSKLYVLASEKRAMIAIGSANLSREGMSSNLEISTIFEISEKNRTYATILKTALEYLLRLSILSHSEQARQQILHLQSVCSNLLAPENDSPGNLAFLHNLDESLLKNIISVTDPESVSRCRIISPFFDSQLHALSEFCRFFPKADIEIYVQQAKSTLPIPVLESFNQLHRVKVFVFEGLDRYMHGKAIILDTLEESYLLSGSANFTTPALLKTAPAGNYEISLFGQIDPQSANAIVSPLRKKPKPIVELSKIQTNPNDPFLNPTKSSNIDLIYEAALRGNEIHLSIDDVLLNSFKPTLIRLAPTDGNAIEWKIKSASVIPIDKNTAKLISVPTTLAIVGTNLEGEIIETNSVWLVNIQQVDRNSHKRKLRLAQSNPFELGSLLAEYLQSGNIEELYRFLGSFDIPLDMVRISGKPSVGLARSSMGNLVGKLGYSELQKSFNDDIYVALEGFAKRLLGKMDTFLENPESRNINAFFNIFFAYFSLLDFIGASLFEMHGNVEYFTPIQWKEIRTRYNYLYRLINEGLDRFTGKNGFMTVLPQLEKPDTDILEDSLEAKSPLVREYKDQLNYIKGIITDSVEAFEYFLANIQVQNPEGTRIPARIFSQDVIIERRKDYLGRASRLVQVDTGPAQEASSVA
jgi:HKD family nuclease